MKIPQQLICYDHSMPLNFKESDTRTDMKFLVCPSGCSFPIINNIPRFVASSAYTSAFGLQWKTFGKTQLDSKTGVSISRKRLIRCLGGSLDIVNGKSVLEAGCGAGRFTEILLESGACVSAFDLSDAVEANWDNCGHHIENYFIGQGDILNLPVASESYDIAICLGVIQHTPDPVDTIKSLTQYLKPGGLLVIDHYSRGYPYIFSRRILRNIYLRLSPKMALDITILLGKFILPIHRIWWRDGRWATRIRHRIQSLSPFVDYFDAYPELGTTQLTEWAILDTYDTLTDRYKHMRSPEEIYSILNQLGMEDIVIALGGNGVEARAVKPLIGNQFIIYLGGES